MSEIDKFRDLPGLVRRLVDDYLSAVKEAEALRQERDGLRAALPKIKADAVREACKYAAQKALDEGFFTIDSNDLLQHANNVEAMAKEQGDGN